MVQTRWVLSHLIVAGNEGADELACLGRQKHLKDLLPLSNCRRVTEWDALGLDLMEETDVVGFSSAGYCLVGKIPHPRGGGGGGYRDGWVGWPQISAFWATSPPPPPRGCGCAFWGFWVCAGL